MIEFKNVSKYYPANSLREEKAAFERTFLF